ncbi:Ig-like domain-containing protein [Vibrio sinaloensis]|nr:Ig-like domain-containing protein [Vibrio sinaloensis]
MGTVDTAGNSTPRISTHLLVDTQSPIPHIAVDSVTQDNVLNALESGQTIAITGTVTGDYHTGDIVNLKINGATISSLTGSVDASGHFFLFQWLVVYWSMPIFILAMQMVNLARYTQ